MGGNRAAAGTYLCDFEAGSFRCCVQFPFAEGDEVLNTTIAFGRCVAILPTSDANLRDVSLSTLAMSDVGLGGTFVVVLGDGLLNGVQSSVACLRSSSTRRTSSTSSRGTTRISTASLSPARTIIHVHITISIGSGWTPLANAPARCASGTTRLHGLHSFGMIRPERPMKEEIGGKPIVGVERREEERGRSSRTTLRVAQPPRLSGAKSFAFTEAVENR